MQLRPVNFFIDALYGRLRANFAAISSSVMPRPWWKDRSAGQILIKLAFLGCGCGMTLDAESFSKSGPEIHAFVDIADALLELTGDSHGADC